MTDVKKTFVFEPLMKIASAKKSLKELENIAIDVQKTIERKDLTPKEQSKLVGDQLFKSGEYKSLASARAQGSRVVMAKDLSVAKRFWGKMHAVASTSVNKTEKDVKLANSRIREHFATGFSMHILQTYAAPAIRAVNAAIKQTISTFSDFDKVYTDFIVKSEEFGRVMTRGELYALSSGEAFSATNFAEAAERFSASGIDVMQNTDALRTSLELATIANIDYNESSNVLIKTMQAYHIPLSDAARITDTMVGVANASTAELKDLSSWFGYAAQSAYLGGVEIEEFSTILGVLSSTGMKNVGAATRQLFMQFQKEAVREKFKGRFGLASDEDFRDMDRVIKQLRTYAQASDDIKGVSRDIAVTIGGKVTAQTALTSLLTAEEKLWIDIGNASLKAGTTAELYTKITDNAWHSLERIKNSLQLIMIQFGEAFAPILKYVGIALKYFVDGLLAIPTSIKAAFGIIVMTAAAGLGALITVVLSYTAAVSIATGAAEMLEIGNARGAETNARGIAVWTRLTAAIANYNKALLSTHAVQTKTTGSTTTLNAAAVTSNRAFKGMSAMMGGAMIAMVGFGIQASATAKHLFAEARVVNMLTSLWIGLHIAKYGGVAGAVAGIGVGGAAFAIGQEQISRSEIDYQIQRTTGTQATYINVDTVTIDNVEDFESFTNELVNLSVAESNALGMIGD